MFFSANAVIITYSRARQQVYHRKKRSLHRQLRNERQNADGLPGFAKKNPTYAPLVANLSLPMVNVTPHANDSDASGGVETDVGQHDIYETAIVYGNDFIITNLRHFHEYSIEVSGTRSPPLCLSRSQSFVFVVAVSG